jgi:hypothetical protein
MAKNGNRSPLGCLQLGNLHLKKNICFEVGIVSKPSHTLQDSKNAIAFHILPPTLLHSGLTNQLHPEKNILIASAIFMFNHVHHVHPTKKKHHSTSASL